MRLPSLQEEVQYFWWRRKSRSLSDRFSAVDESCREEHGLQLKYPAAGVVRECSGFELLVYGGSHQPKRDLNLGQGLMMVSHEDVTTGTEIPVEA